MFMRPIESVDGLLLRVLVTLTGAALGAMVSVTLVLLLRSWRIWYASPAASMLSLIGGAAVFGAAWLLVLGVGLSGDAAVLSRPRRAALMAAMPLFTLTAGGILVITALGAPTALRQVTFLRILALMLVTHVAGAVMIAEVARITIRQTSHWPDRRHFAGVAVVWVVLFASGGFLLWRSWQKLLVP